MLSLDQSGRNAASRTGAWATAITIIICCTAVATATSSLQQTRTAYRGDFNPIHNYRDSKGEQAHNDTLRGSEGKQAFPWPLFTPNQTSRAVGPGDWTSTNDGPSATLKSALYRRFEAAANAALQMVTSLRYLQPLHTCKTSTICTFALVCKQTALDNLADRILNFLTSIIAKRS